MTRRRRILVFLAFFAIALLLALFWLSRPSSVGAIVTRQAGSALGLEIHADGISEYRLRGTPLLVLRDVRVRESGAQTFLLTARRIYVALPWSTVRGGGSDLVAQRIELDAPRIDLPALQHWLATRPPSEKRMPTLTDGLRIRNGEIVNDDWRIDRIDADLPLLHPTQPLQASLRGRYLAAPLTIPLDLAVAMSRPEALIGRGNCGFATRGTMTIEQGTKWRLPATVSLSGPLHVGEDDLRITPARLAAAATYESGTTRIPFALGVFGPLHFDEATWTLAPAGLALRRRGGDEASPVPTLDAHGAFALGRQLTLQLDGELAQWPQAWPALPPPVGQSRAPLPFALRYDGAPDLRDVLTLHLERNASRFDGRFKLLEMLAWVDQKNGSPLPPLSGSLTTPKIGISGATLEGVEVEFDEDDAATAQGNTP